MPDKCHIFMMDSADEAYKEMDFETVIDYGDEQYGHYLHVWDDGGRKLLKCRKCGAYVLMQKSEYHSFTEAPDGYYTDWFPVSGPEEADELNRKYGGLALEQNFAGRNLCRTNGRIHWSDNGQFSLSQETPAEDDATDNTDGREDYVNDLIKMLLAAVADDKTFIVPVSEKKDDDGKESLSIRMVLDQNGHPFLPVFTGQEELEKSNEQESREFGIDALIKYVLDEEELYGIVFDPFGDSRRISKGILWIVIVNKERDDSDRTFYNKMIDKAVQYASDCYKDHTRSETGEPFITHPLEVMSILNNMHMIETDPLTVIAGILHEVKDIGAADLDTIQWKFGHYVSALIEFILKDESLSWKEDKQRIISGLHEADHGKRMLVMADIVADTRMLIRDHRLIGDSIWTEREADKKDLAWYYNKVQEELYDLQFYDDTRDIYWEMVDLYKDLFVEYYYDEANKWIYAVDINGEGSLREKDEPQWRPWIGDVPDSAEKVNRRYSERIEDNWDEEFDRSHAVKGAYFENYIAAVKEHLRGFLKTTTEEDLNRLLVENMEYIKWRFDHDREAVYVGEMKEERFIVQSAAITADRLERIAGQKISMYYALKDDNGEFIALVKHDVPGNKIFSWENKEWVEKPSLIKIIFDIEAGYDEITKDEAEELMKRLIK